MDITELKKARTKADEILWDAIAQIGYNMAADLADELRRKTGDQRLYISTGNGWVHRLGRKIAEALAVEYELPS